MKPKAIKLAHGERIVAVVPERCCGPGWSNAPVWVYISTNDGQLRQECRKCPHLAAIDRNERMTPEAKDEAKAWTCATHFLLESKPDVHCEQILFDKSDDAFNARLAESFAAEYDDGSLDDGN